MNWFTFLQTRPIDVAQLSMSPLQQNQLNQSELDASST